MTLVTVTEQDILTGKRGQIGECPVAKALTRAYGRPMFSGSTCFGDGACLSKLPDAVGDWVMKFDAGLPVPRIWFYA